jgi:PAS domain S-box-containing protein
VCRSHHGSRICLVACISLATVFGSAQPGFAATWLGPRENSQSLNWSLPSNWSEGQSIAGQPVEFDLAGAGPVGQVTNIVDQSLTIESLSFRNPGGAHTTQIPAGVTLTIQGARGLTVGTADDRFASAQAKYSIYGDGKLAVFDHVFVSAMAAPGAASAVVLDLSRLRSFALDGTRTQSYLSVGDSVGFKDRGSSGPVGIVYLAQTNWLSVNGYFTVGYFSPSQPPPNQASALYLGRSNEIYAVEVGAGYNNSFESRLAFNPVFIRERAQGRPPRAQFRGARQSLSPRVTWWIVGANVAKAAIPSLGICDLSGGVVDALVETMRVGRGSASKLSGKGTLIFDGGRIDVNVVEIGSQSEYKGGDGIGLIQVNAAADRRTRATLRVNDRVILGGTIGAPAPGTTGTLEINGGLVRANMILGGGGTSRVLVDRGTLEVDDTLGSPQAPIGSLELRHATLRFESPSQPSGETRTLIVGDGPNRISFAGFPKIRAFPTTLPFLKFAAHQGTGKLQLDAVPEGYAAHLAIDDATGTVAVIITDGPVPWWQRWWAKALLAAIIAATVGGFYVVRVRTMEAARRKLEQQVIDRTQELQRLNAKLAEAYQLTDAANRELESRVTARTAELEVAITELRHEVSERKRLEQEYRGIFENAVEGIYRTTVGGQFLAANPAMAAMLGYASADELIASVTDISRQLYVDAQQRAEFTEQLRRQHIVRRFECQMRRKGGAVITVVTSARAELSPHGDVLYYEGTLEDVTEHKRLEEQFRHAQKVEMVGQLAGGVAHDFNNLLTVINVNAGLVLDADRLDADDRDSLEQIQAAGTRAGALTRQLLAFSRKQAPNPTLVDLNQVITQITNMVRRLIGENITLELQLAPVIKPLLADAGMIEQVLVNLAVNARDAMPRGGKLTLTTKIVTFDEAEAAARSVAPGAFASLTMQDTGIGIAPEIRDRIFEPFFTTKEPGKGTGLGLATVARIIQQHRGGIDVDSVVGTGTTFSTYWPLAPDAAALAADLPSTVPTVVRGTETLLLVEDERSVRATAARGLRGFGYQILEASDGQEAIDLWKQHRAEIALMITDQIMPGDLTGAELAVLLQKDKPGLPVICTTGYTGEARPTTEASGIFHYLPKPYDVHILVRLIRDLLDAAAPRST